WSRRYAHPREVRVERLAADPFVRVSILLGRRLDHVVGKRRRWRLVVPAARVQPVADVLLVERRLGPARRVALGRPEPRRVGGPHLVDQGELLGLAVEPELEL